MYWQKKIAFVQHIARNIPVTYILEYHKIVLHVTTAMLATGCPPENR
jgi:hypothetical protein